MEDKEYLAYFKYTGKKVEDGFLDARKSAETLIAIDEIIRYFLYQKNKEIASSDFEIPVKIEKGSWVAWLPGDIGTWLGAALAAGAASYIVTAMNEMAKNDVGEKGLKDIFKSIIKGLKWAIEIGKHIKSTNVKQFPNAQIKEENGIILIGIPAEDGSVLWVPKDYVEMYTKMPDKLLSNISKNIDTERELAIDFSNSEANDKDDTGHSATISEEEKWIFHKTNDENEVLFPELKHNDYVELEGHLTRGNENTNTIGFEYSGHVLTCYPQQGRIISDKERLFTNCIMRGYVDRLNQEGGFIEKRPRIKYLDLIPVKSKKEKGLFD